MSVLSILKAGNPLLRQRALPVEPATIASTETRALIRDMFETMSAAHGQGLAAPQIGVLKRIVVVRLFSSAESHDDEDAPAEETFTDRVLINPEIKPLETIKHGSWEGCLSLPGLAGFVERPRKIQLRFLDEKGKVHEETVRGYEAVVYQHECDHLDGVLYIDRLADSRLFGFDEDLDTKALRSIVAGR